MGRDEQSKAIMLKHWGQLQHCAYICKAPISSSEHQEEDISTSDPGAGMSWCLSSLGFSLLPTSAASSPLPRLLPLVSWKHSFPAGFAVPPLIAHLTTLGVFHHVSPGATLLDCVTLLCLGQQKPCLVMLWPFHRLLMPATHGAWPGFPY